MTPKPWAVVLIENVMVDFQVGLRTNNSSGIAYIQSSKETSYMGELGENTPVFWCDDEETAKTTLRLAQERYPKNSYAICQTKLVSYVPASPPIQAQFTPAGLLPT